MEKLIDERGNTHSLTMQLGKDGQGTLYATKNPTVVIRDSQDREGDRLLYDDVKLLPLSEVDNILLPDCCLRKPSVGYSLNIPEGFAPLSNIMSSDKNNESLYLKTGGVKRRLGLLVNLAKILAELHGLAVMYASMSPNRVFISNDNSSNLVYLLYSVKMSCFMSFKVDDDGDPYMAPEAKSGKGACLAGDVYAYAALARDLLTDYETRPIITDGISALFRQAFGSADKRPTIMDFYTLFTKTSDCLLTCQKCGTGFLSDAPKCPACSAAPPKMMEACIYDIISETRVDRGVKILEFAPGRQCFWNYHTESALLCETPKPAIDCAFNISADKKLHFIFKNLMDKPITLNEKTVAPGQSGAVALPAKKILISYKLCANTERFIEMAMK